MTKDLRSSAKMVHRNIWRPIDKIKEKYHIKTRVIGDSSRLGKIGEAVRDGFYAATSL